MRENEHDDDALNFCSCFNVLVPLNKKEVVGKFLDHEKRYFLFTEKIIRAKRVNKITICVCSWVWLATKFMA